MDSLDREASFLDHLGCTTGREQAHILLDEALSEVEQAGLVVDRQDGDLLVRLGGHCRVCISRLLRVGRRGTFAGRGCESGHSHFKGNGSCVADLANLTSSPTIARPSRNDEFGE